MAREFKFREWHNNHMRTWEEIDFMSMRVLNDGKGIFEQYTGSKDIYNMEIYEGDIVMLVFPDGYGGYDDSDEIGQVSWNNADSRFEIYEYSGLLTTNALRVIGNIHENPELLEEK